MNKKFKLIAGYCAAIVCGVISAFFIFYETRLLFITKGLTEIRAGGGGTYIGAAAFPVLAITFGFIAWRLFKSARKNRPAKR